MSRIQTFPGAVDHLTEGLLAGSKFANTQAQLVSTQLQNALAAEELSFVERRQQLFEAATEAEIMSREAAAEYNQALTDGVRALEDAKKRRAEAEATTAEAQAGVAGEVAEQQVARGKQDLRTAEAREAELQVNTLAKTLASFVDQDPTMEESRAYIQTQLPQLEMLLGRTPNPAELELYAKQAHEGAMISERARKAEEARRDQLNLLTGSQILSNQLKDLSMREEFELEVKRGRLDEMNEAYLKLLAIGTAVGDTSEAKALKAEIDKLEDELKGLTLPKNRGRDEGEAGPDAFDGDGFLPRPKTESEYNAIPDGARYIHPDDGKIHTKGR